MTIIQDLLYSIQQKELQTKLLWKNIFDSELQLLFTGSRTPDSSPEEYR